MRTLLTALFFLQGLFAGAQATFKAIDTTASCAPVLYNEYSEKFKSFNKEIVTETAKQRSLTKEIYSEIQEDFLQKINSHNFICDNEINPYLQGLMKEVLTANGIKPAGYRMLLSRDSEINAYNTGDGTIVVHYGLFLAVDNEDELVSVIAHEIGHQYLGHVKKDIEGFAKQSTSEEMVKQTREIRRQKYGKATMANNLLKRMSYQNYDQRRKKEIEADSIGFVFYKKTGRDLKAAVSLLQKLDAADSESDSLTIADYKLIFEKNGFTVKQKYFEQEQSLFTKYDKTKRFDVDSLKTHPDCATRIQLIQGHITEGLSGKTNASGTFAAIKKNSTYQSLFNMYAEKEYGRSLYEALKQFKKSPDDAILKNIIYINLEKIQAARANYTINRYVPAHDNLTNTASLNRFISFLNNIRMADYELLISNFKS